MYTQRRLPTELSARLTCIGAGSAHRAIGESAYRSALVRSGVRYSATLSASMATSIEAIPSGAEHYLESHLPKPQVQSILRQLPHHQLAMTFDTSKM